LDDVSGIASEVVIPNNRQDLPRERLDYERFGQQRNFNIQSPDADDPVRAVTGREQRRQEGQALGRSHGGFSSKSTRSSIFDGLPLAAGLPPDRGRGQRKPQLRDPARHFAWTSPPRAVLGDKSYDAKASREAARKRGIRTARMPAQATTPVFFPEILYKGRARAEQGVGNIKH
jgi:hypothetical protein